MIPVQRPCLREEELIEVGKVFATRWLGLGSRTKEFEDRLKTLLGVKHIIAVNTGTSALHLALEALRLNPGDEVIVPSLTFVASVQAILMAGAKPVFCDVTADTLNLDIESVKRLLSPKSRAIMPVHYGGLACEMDQVLAFAEVRDLWVVEDAAHAFGSSYKGRNVGTFGDLTCFSFDPIYLTGLYSIQRRIKLATDSADRLCRSCLGSLGYVRAFGCLGIYCVRAHC